MGPVVRRVGAVAVLALLLVGCQVRVDTTIDLREDDTAVVDLTIGIMLQEGLPPELTEGATEDPLSTADAEDGISEAASTCGFDPSLAAVEPYEEDGFEGVSIRLDGVPIAAVNCFFSEESDSQFFESFSITREGEEFVFDATVVDIAAALQEGLGAGGLGGQKRVVAQEEAPQDPQDLEALQSELEALQSELPEGFPTDFPTDFPSDLDDAFGDAFGDGFADALANPEDLLDITVAITFPGEVGENNATRVEGTTAVWEVGAEQTRLMARGAASPGGGSDLLLWLLVGLAVLIGLGLVLFLVLRGRRKGTPAQGLPGLPGDFGGAPQQGWPQQPSAGPPPGAPGQAPGGFPPQGQPPQVQPPQGQPGGFPPQGQPGGFPPQGQPPQGQPPQGQPGGFPPQQPQPPQGGDGGGNPDATRTFRPEDLLPPRDPDQG